MDHMPLIVIYSYKYLRLNTHQGITVLVFKPLKLNNLMPLENLKQN